MKTPLPVLLFIAGLNSALASDFVTETWPGEGVPRFSAKDTVLNLHNEPSKDAPHIVLPFRSGWKIDFDKSKFITKKSVTLTAIAVVTDIYCKKTGGDKPTIKPGETIEYLQYRAEGYVTARYKGDLCEVFLMDNIPKFEGLDKQPEVEWWIRVVDVHNKPLGWLLVDDNQVNFMSRSI